jgi:hypothetical protein
MRGVLQGAGGARAVGAGGGLGWDGALSLYSRARGQVAQLVEQRTENPRVGGSIPSLAIGRNSPLDQGIQELRAAQLGWPFFLSIVPEMSGSNLSRPRWCAGRPDGGSRRPAHR